MMGLRISRKVSAILIAVAAAYIAVEGTLGLGLFRHWTFVLMMLAVLISTVLTATDDLRNRSYSSAAAHLGLALVLFGGILGEACCTDAQIRVMADGSEENIAFTANGEVVQLPFSISLKEFRIGSYEDGVSPKQYTSVLSSDGKELSTSVNHPCRYKGYRIYQSGYDPEAQSYSILKVVRDPWLPVVAMGALLLAVSAFISLKETWKSWKMLLVAALLAVLFTALSVARISFGTLPPALRSLWFIPHLIVYMLAYAIMALSFIAVIVSLFTDKVPANLSRRLLNTASSLLLIGMLCGAVWAKQAWGDYWTWDAKECWAAVTWLLTLAVTHVTKQRASIIFTVLAFLAIQMTWYGVNYLPSSTNSLHTYNQERAI